MRITSSIQFYCRDCKKNKQGFAPIEVCITINKQRTFISLPRKEYPSQFKKQIQSKKNNDIKEFLEEIRNKINQTQTHLLQQNIPITPNTIKEHMINGNKKQSITIEILFDDYIVNTLNPNVLPVTKNKYILTKNYLCEYLGKNTLANTLTKNHFLGFSNYLKTKHLQKDSTIAGYMQKCRSVITNAFYNGDLQANAMGGVKINKGRVKLLFLSPEEVERIEKIEHESSAINKVRDLFIVQLNTGLAYSDLMRLEERDIQQQDNIYYINKRRQKTDVEYTSVILPKGIEILKKYDYKLPHISNQKYNLYLKYIQDIACINKTITTHLARKTYATNLLNAGVPLNVVSKCLGHSNTNITQKHYAKTLTTTVLHSVADVINF